MAFNEYIFYTSVRFNSLSISNIENFERFLNLNSVFSYEMISEQFNDVSSIDNMAFNLFKDPIYYLSQLFNGHLNRHNRFLLVLSDAYVHAVPLVVRTIYSSKIIVRLLYVILVLSDI